MAKAKPKKSKALEMAMKEKDFNLKNIYEFRKIPFIKIRKAFEEEILCITPYHLPYSSPRLITKIEYIFHPEIIFLAIKIVDSTDESILLTSPINPIKYKILEGLEVPEGGMAILYEKEYKRYKNREKTIKYDMMREMEIEEEREIERLEKQMKAIQNKGAQRRLTNDPEDTM